MYIELIDYKIVFFIVTEVDFSVLLIELFDFVDATALVFRYM